MYKIFSHNDLDGYSVNVICEFYKINADIKNINNKSVDYELMVFFENSGHLDYDKVFLIDLYVNNETAEYINKNINNFILIDHHKTGEFLNIYNWANVITTKDNISTCGASLFYDYLCEELLVSKNKLMDRYVESVRLFDTGEYLVEKYKKEYIPEELNVLFYLYFKRFPYKICENMRRNKILNENDKEISRALLSRMRIYALNKSKEIINFKFEGYNIGVLFIEDPVNINNTFRVCLEKYPHCDFFMFVNMFNSISLRTNKPIDLAYIASKYNGGGHLSAVGMPYNKELILKILNIKK